MKITDTDNNKKVGGTIESWCRKCELLLPHTIETMVGNRPARVQCNTCKAQHSYKARQSGASTAGQGQIAADAAPESQPARRRTSQYRRLLKGKDMALARAYSSSDRFALGDVMEHASFGFGIATGLKDGTKIEVLFESGSKLLIHDR
jgi:hypothetical protein